MERRDQASVCSSDSGTSLQPILSWRLLAWTSVRLATSSAYMMMKGSVSFTESF